MYFMNINALVHRLKTNTLSNYQQAQYYLALMLFTAYALVMQKPVSAVPASTNILQVMLPMWIDMIVMLAGTLYCYNINKSGDDKDFLTRMLCLALTCKIRLTIIGFIIAIPCLVLIAPFALPFIATIKNPITFYAINGLLGFCWAVFLYWYIGKQFRKVAQ